MSALKACLRDFSHEKHYIPAGTADEFEVLYKAQNSEFAIFASSTEAARWSLPHHHHLK
jgi:hypothetical protein